MAKFADGDMLSHNEGLILKGHLTLEEFNELAVEEYGEDPATAVRHYYVRMIPAQPGDEYPFWVHDWGNKPSRGALKATSKREAKANG